jgi:hypothetical protein
MSRVTQLPGARPKTGNQKSNWDRQRKSKPRDKELRWEWKGDKTNSLMLQSKQDARTTWPATGTWNTVLER